MTAIADAFLQSASGVVSWFGGLSIDADGSPHAYHPDGSKGLDALGNAGKPGNWWGVVTDNGQKTGTPIIQSSSDPAPGFYVSATSLSDSKFPRNDPRRYVDSERIPFIAVPSELREKYGVNLGDLALCQNTKNGLVSAAIVADIGPRGKIGEGSIALANALGIKSSPRSGGTKDPIVYTMIWTGSRHSPAWPLSVEEIVSGVNSLLSPNAPAVPVPTTAVVVPPEFPLRTPPKPNFFRTATPYVIGGSLTIAAFFGGIWLLRRLVKTSTTPPAG